MTRLPRLAGMVVLAIVSFSCDARPAPTAAQVASIAPAAPNVDATLAWMQERTLRCEEQPAVAASRRWECTGTAPWNDDLANQLTVSIAQDGQGQTQLLATLDATQTQNHEVCSGQICDPYVGFFADTIAKSPLTGASGLAIAHWIEEHARTGGQVQFDRLSVRYRPTLPIMTIRIDIASAGG